MLDQEPTPFNFWCPATELGKKVMIWSLCIIGFLVFIKGCVDEDLPGEFGRYGDPAPAIATVLFYYVALNVAGWYIIFNIGRFAYSQMSRTETVTTMREAQREKAELEALRRRKEIQQLKAELGDNDKDDALGDDASDDVNNP